MRCSRSVRTSTTISTPPTSAPSSPSKNGRDSRPRSTWSTSTIIPLGNLLVAPKALAGYKKFWLASSTTTSRPPILVSIARSTTTLRTSHSTQKVYADFSHDDILISILTAMSLDYLNDPPSITQFPPDPNRHFILSHLTPFAARLAVEVIGCGSSNPTAVKQHRTAYSATQYGYNPSNATNKFIRMRLNQGILPISTIRGGDCRGRTDGMCPLPNFLKSQAGAYDLSNYQYTCFANYTIPYPNNGTNYDGTFNATAANATSS